MALQAQNRLGEARELLQMVLDRRVEKYGKENYQVAVSLSNLATNLCEERQFSKARERFEEALSIMERVRGTDSTEAATIYSNLGAGLQVLVLWPTRALAQIVHDINHKPSSSDKQKLKEIMQ